MLRSTGVVLVALVVAVAIGSFSGAGLASAQTLTSQPADRLTCGDWKIDVGISATDLTAEKKAELKPIFEGFAKEIKAAKDAFDEKAKPTAEKIKAMRDAARQNGTMKDLLNQDDYKALQAEMGKTQAEETKASAARHDRILDEVLKALTPSQKRRFMMRAGLASQDPKRILQSRAAIVIDQWAAGVELTDPQYDQLMTKIAAMIEKHDADVAETKETNQLKVREWWQSLDKKMREFIEDSLTGDQKKQAAATRLDRFQRTTASITDRVAKSIDRLDPTADQKERAAALAAAAREAMLKLEPEDQDAWGKLYARLRGDVDRLLTEEQRTKRDKPIEIGPKLAP